MMRIANALHLTYCLNVHSGESWNEQFHAIRDHAEPILRRVAGNAPAGLGLRLSAQSAAFLLAEPSRLHTLRRYLADHALYALTVNAFPYGRFHGTCVKDSVYRPAWNRPERLAYSLDAARVLAALLPEGVSGSVSTAPLAFKGWPDWQRDVPEALGAFAEAGRRLAALQKETGRRIVLSMEPEPFCYPETTEELHEVFAELPSDARRQHLLGCCLDLAHQAVEFEPLADSVTRLQRAEIPIGKIQLSAAIEAETGPEAREHLRDFADPVYLHQTLFRRADGISRFSDLPHALATDRLWEPGGTVRVHYHVPLFVERFGALRSTSLLLEAPTLVDTLLSGIAPTLELETYTWKVWQDATGETDCIDDGIVRELEWARHLLRARQPREA